jgi:cell division protein FtsB
MVAAQSSASELEEENAKLRARIAELEAALAKLATEALAAIKGNGE